MFMRSRQDRRGFTLVELTAVMVIIGILLSFIVVAARDGIRRAEERATQALLMKLDTGIADRIEALLTTRVVPTNLHGAIAGAYYTSGSPAFVPGLMRAQVIAQYDFMRAELPDVFYVTSSASPLSNYPLNFAGNPYARADASDWADYDYVLPLGAQTNNPAFPALGASGPGTGIHGASYTAAAGIYKNLGYLPAGYDTVDNDGDRLIDESDEGVNATNSALVTGRLKSHEHKTARSEVLYAVLVEGEGPFGSVFAADEFTEREVRDTDGDGLPEFVDAWGEPLQFYRWPIFYHSDLQKGYYDSGTGGPYAGAFEPREQDPLDPNQQLMAPAWWYKLNFGPPGTPIPSDSEAGGGVVLFQTYFHSLVEPLGATRYRNPAGYWDRGETYPHRRAYFSKFLIASSGPDHELGIAQLSDSKLSVPNLLLENQAAQATLNRTTEDIFQAPLKDATNQAITNGLIEAGADDITNHSIMSAGGGLQ